MRVEHFAAAALPQKKRMFVKLPHSKGTVLYVTVWYEVYLWNLQPPSMCAHTSDIHKAFGRKESCGSYAHAPRCQSMATMCKHLCVSAIGCTHNNPQTHTARGCGDNTRGRPSTHTLTQPGPRLVCQPLHITLQRGHNSTQKRNKLHYRLLLLLSIFALHHINKQTNKPPCQPTHTTHMHTQTCCVSHTTVLYNKSPPAAAGIDSAKAPSLPLPAWILPGLSLPPKPILPCLSLHAQPKPPNPNPQLQRVLLLLLLLRVLTELPEKILSSCTTAAALAGLVEPRLLRNPS